MKVTRMKSDEAYILDLCDELIGRRSLRQHRFFFLRGDSGKKLPVDAYYPGINLVIAYRERQHSESVPFFDRRPTVSGVSRGLQRATYDERRRVELPRRGIHLIELNVHDFPQDSRKRLLWSREKDIVIIRAQLAKAAHELAKKPFTKTRATSARVFIVK